ncbi:MAG: radical SAM protein, partial [Sediminibacterium sp.]|nr:radical SAM protein [Sediminibacterium sp.]
EVLIKYEFIISENQNEFDFLHNINESSINENESLSYTIQPTSNCQLGCHYCGQKHSKHTMSDDISDKVLNRINKLYEMNKSRIKNLSITWYGGEPLMALHQIINLSKKLIELSDRNKLSYNANIITNGLSLKEEIAKDLIDNCKINHFQITIDTTKEFHDKRRITKSGFETYDIIINNIVKLVNLKEFINSNSSLLIRMNIDKVNQNGVVHFIDELNNLGLHNSKVSLNFAPVTDWGSLKANNGFTVEEFAIKEIDWCLYAIKKGFKFQSFLPERTTQSCMVVNKNSEVYDTFGNIYPCYEFPYTPKYTVDSYTIGNLKFDEKTFNDNAITRNWFNDVKSESVSHCKQCTFYPVCGGGCPKLWYEGTQACPTFKFNIEDRLILEYLTNKTNIK